MLQVSERPRKGVLPAIGLFFIAPLVAEFLLGNLPMKLLGALVVLAPMYGGGALLIREVVRRTGRGWPSIVLLGLAYGIIEEAFTTQSLFNPNYLKLNMHLLDPGFIPALGIGAWWTVFVLALHMIWSTSASIVLVESAVPDRAETPWLGKIGLAVTAALFVLGAAASTWIQLRQDSFLATGKQFAASTIAVLLLVIAAFLLPRRMDASDLGPAPNPWVVGGLALAAGSAILLMPSRWGWGAAGLILLLELGVAALVWSWSRKAAWGQMHELALGAGAALAYGWHAFIQTPVLSGGASARAGNALFLCGALALIGFAARRIRAFRRDPVKALV